MTDSNEKYEEILRMINNETFRITVIEKNNERTEHFDYDFWTCVSHFVILEHAISFLIERNGVEYEGLCECVGISPLRDFWFKGESCDRSGFLFSDLAMTFTDRYIKTRDDMLSRFPKFKLKETVTFDAVVDNFRQIEIEEKCRLEAA